MKYYLTFLIIILGSFLLSAQTKITGTLLDSESGDPIVYAEIWIEGTNSFATSDENGYFELNSETNNSVQVHVRHLNYKELLLTWNSDTGFDTPLELETVDFLLEEILITGNSFQDKNGSGVIFESEKEIIQPKDVGEVLRGMPGFGVVRRGGYALDPVFRSFQKERLAISYDGITQMMHACPNRMDPITTHVVPDEIERVEIIKGPFSVKQGPSFGSILNIATTGPESSGLGWGGSVLSSYESNGDGLTLYGKLGYNDNKYSFSVNGGFKDYGDYKDGDGNIIPSAFKSSDYAIKAGWKGGEKHHVQVGFRQSFGRDILHAGLPMDTKYDNSSAGSLHYRITKLGSGMNSFDFKMYGAIVDHQMTNINRPNFMMVEAVANVKSRSAGFKASYKILKDNRMALQVGIDGNRLEREGTRNRLVKRNMMTGEPLPEPIAFVDNIWQDAWINQIGTYAESDLYFGRSWVVRAGLRLDYTQSGLDDPDPKYLELYPDYVQPEYWTVGGHIGVTRVFSDGWNLQVNLGRGVRTPSMEEAYIFHFNIGQDPFEYVGNPDLKAEINHQIEFGLEKTAKNWQAGVSVFYSDMSNYITAMVDSSIRRKYMPMAQPRYAKRFVNIENAFQTGFELNGNVDLSRAWNIYGYAQYIYAQNTDWDEPLPQIEPFTTSLGLKYQPGSFFVDNRVRMVSKQNRYAPSFGETQSAGYTTWDIRVGYAFPIGISVGAACSNVLDNNYYDHLNFSYRNSNLNGRINEPGRSFTFYLKYSF